MPVDGDDLGLVRKHRWIDVKAQKARLEDHGCGRILDLSEYDRADIERLAMSGRAFCLVHAFLLAEPRKRRVAGGMMQDFELALRRIMKRGSTVWDVGTGLETTDQLKTEAMLVLVKEQIRRSNQGFNSAINGRRTKGRQLVKFLPEQERAAKAIWRDMIEYPTWTEAENALRLIKSAKGEKFTMARAHRLWGPRKHKR